MTDSELEHIKNLPTPAPRPEARAAALAAARAAFLKSRERVAEPPKEVTPSPRPMPGSNRARSSRMQAKHFYALAASVAVIAVGTPIAWQVARQQPATQRISEPAAQPDRTDIGRRDEEFLARQQAAQRQAEEARRAAVDAVALAQKQAEAESARKLEAERARIVDGNRPAGKPDADATARREAQLQPAAPPPVTTGRAENRPTGLALLPPPPVAGDVRAQTRSGLGVASAIPQDEPAKPMITVEEGRDKFPEAKPNPVTRVAEEPVSTFSADVDTASYSFVRRALNAGRLPAKDAVRVEEMINYFPYSYPTPESREQPFLPTVTVVPSPWNPGRQLVHIALKGYALKAAERPRANLVFLVDTSGSMGPEDRLPLVRNALRLLVGELRPEDTIGIVTYAGQTSVALEPTRVADRAKILAALDKLIANGSTAGAAGLQQAYAMAEAGFDKAAVNRIVLATDGDFNVGITDRRELKSFIERKRETGIYLSILGVGIGNHNDQLMQTLAQAGNGVAAYIDTLGEARKVLVEEASSSLFPIAGDVKIQVEFNPATVSEYRLVGYETRALRREDFNNDKVDAGDLGSGHAVTAIYEIAPVGAPAAVDALRYGKPAQPAATAPAQSTAELGYLKLRYKLPKEQQSRLIELAITPRLAKTALAEASDDVRFAVAVAGFGQLLKGSADVGGLTYDDVIALASSAKGEDPFGYRAELVSLVRLAKSAQP